MDIDERIRKLIDRITTLDYVFDGEDEMPERTLDHDVFNVEIKNFVKEVLEYVKPSIERQELTTPDHYTGFEIAVDEMEAKQKELRL